MISLEHVNVVVRDIPETLTFYQAAFPHWKVRGGGSGEWYGKPRKWVHFGDDYHYLAFSDHGKTAARDLKGDQVGLAHYAFTVSNLEALIQRLQNAGYQVAIWGGNDDTQKSVYFIDPNGIEVEFVQYLVDLPELRNQYVD
ncbi:glyoxalase [Shewanella sp. OPT22]|nr:glyoxalase [Shewanella sp. OPT22]